MIVRLIGTMIVLVLIAFFAGFNLDNKCSVNLLVHEFENVPDFFTIIISFVAGILFSLPFALIHRSSKQKNNESAKPSVKEPKKVRSFFFKKKNVDEKKNEMSHTKSAESTETQNEKSDQSAKTPEKEGESDKKTVLETDAK